MIIEYKKNKFNVSMCKSNTLGLMFRFPKNDGILFVFKKAKYIALHTFFVFYPIDIIYLNKDKKVIKVSKRILPFTLFLKPIKCKYILELKNCKNLKVNDITKF